MFLGDGQPNSDVDSNMMMAVSRFLQKHSKFISVLVGGYPSFHQEPSQPVPNGSKEPVPEPSPNKLDNIKTNLKMKSANLKDSLINYIYNPSTQEPKHIDYSKRGSKLYKNTGRILNWRTHIFELLTGDVFCLEDDEDENVVDLKDLEKQSDTIHLATCQRVGETGLLSPCHLLITTSQLVVLNPGPRYEKCFYTGFYKFIPGLVLVFHPPPGICPVL